MCHRSYGEVYKVLTVMKKAQSVHPGQYILVDIFLFWSLEHQSLLRVFLPMHYDDALHHNVFIHSSYFIPGEAGRTKSIAGRWRTNTGVPLIFTAMFRNSSRSLMSRLPYYVASTVNFCGDHVATHIDTVGDGIVKLQRGDA